MQEFIKEKKLYFIIIGAVLLIAGGIWYNYHEKNKSVLLIEQGDVSGNDQDKNPSNALSSNDVEVNSAIEEQSKTIMVHIAGQVKNPGVINIIEGARLIEAIEQLGGATEEADLEVVNLAQKLRDEEKIYIPKKGEVSNEKMFSNFNIIQGQKDDLVNINTASLEQLKTLSGIGDVIAGNIIEYRESNGGFKSKEEIKQVNRIGDKIYNDIKDKIEI